MKDKISVAVTTYNGERFLSEQLDSLYSQTLLPDEIIVVDDCSTDGTIDILETYHKRHGLIYFQNDKNLGINKNFEEAILKCTGDYIALCDQDDVWWPDKIKKSYNKLKVIEKDQPSVVTSGCIMVDANLKSLTKQISENDTDSYYTTLFGHHSQGSSLMMNRAILKYIIPFPSDNKIFYDIFIGLSAAMIGNKYNIAEPLMFYRCHDSNACNRLDGEKIPLKQLIKLKFSDRYPDFIPEARFFNMKIVASRQSIYFHPQRTALFNKLMSLDDDLSLLKKIQIISSIKELRLIKKLESISNTIVAHLMQKTIIKK